MYILTKIQVLTKQLLPTGKAFWIPVGGVFEKLLNGIHASEERAYDDAVAILDDALPDNDNFLEDDASAWETRLGLISNPLVPLADRKLAIARKMAHPGTIKTRQNWRYLQAQLQAAGFDVYVYENRFPDGFGGYVTKTPADFSLLPFPVRLRQYGQFQYGQTQYGGTYLNRIINNINENLDFGFSTGSNLKSTFFIGGPTEGSWAIIDANRKDEFRQLVLRIKPVQTIAYTLISFY